MNPINREFARQANQKVHACAGATEGQLRIALIPFAAVEAVERPHPVGRHFPHHVAHRLASVGDSAPPSVLSMATLEQSQLMTMMWDNTEHIQVILKMHE